jgi:signal recognition particle subunit SEC65
MLDIIGFKQGRGRVSDFQNYLTTTSPKYFKHLKYTTVRAWFQDHAPPMRKIDAIIETLQVNYKFQHDVAHIKTWWKAGGYYPFIENTSDSHPSIIEIIKKVDAVKEKHPFLIMSIVTEEAGELFKTLTGGELIRISDKAAYFADNYVDPLNIDCPEEYLRIIIKHELRKIMSNRHR